MVRVGMGQRSKRASRCDACRMQSALCLCAEIPRLELATRVVLVMHHREISRTTATGPLALRALTNGELQVHGARDAALDLSALHGQGRRVMVLFPSDDARPLTPELLAADRRPVTLVVPDGNWRQASRAARRIPGLAQAEPVALVAGAPSRYRLRREPREGGLATFEAIARALGILESAAVRAQLETLFLHMVERTLDTRGRAPTADATPAAPPLVAAPPLEIIYRDADLVAVNKPAGMLVHRGWARDGRPALQILRDQIGRHVYPVHRLDRATSGVLLFALRGEVARLVQTQLDAHEVEKRYLALCRGHDPGLVQVDHPLSKTEGGERRPAVTDFRLLGQFERYGLFEARPRTGRLHQIRRHLKHASHPIIGDARYGKGEHNRLFRERFGFHRLALHASDLGLRQPRTGEPLLLHAPVPPELARLFHALGLSPQP
jgi:tRNA pseudouridine65 synthase